MRDKRADTNITPAALDAFRRGAASDLAVSLGLAPWEINPLALHLFPKPSPEILNGRDKIWWSSWAKADRLRKELEAACARGD
jgi:hypothetical protein